MKILIIANKIPNNDQDTSGIFVKRWADALARNNEFEVSIISPINLLKFSGWRSVWSLDYTRKPYRENRVKDSVLRPFYIGFGFKSSTIVELIMHRLSLFFFAMAVKRSVKKYKIDFDFVYGHFLSPAGLVSIDIGNDFDAFSILFFGDSVISGKFLANGFVRRKLEKLNFWMLANQDQNWIGPSPELIETKRQTHIFPNCVDFKRFPLIAKADARKVLGLHEDIFLVGFVGALGERKGSDRVSRAIFEIDGAYGLFVGPGQLGFRHDRAIVVGSVNPSRINQYLRAMDIFVLPTTHEGSCNAVLEALACSLPVVTSSGACMDEITSEDCCLRIDPMDVSEIKRSIMCLKSDIALREKMAKKSLEFAQKFDIERRVERFRMILRGFQK